MNSHVIPCDFWCDFRIFRVISVIFQDLCDFRVIFVFFQDFRDVSAISMRFPGEFRVNSV